MSEQLEEKKESHFKKLFSVKFWVTIWAMAVVSYIVFANKTDFIIIAQWLSSVPLAYLGLNVWQKKIISESVEKSESSDRSEA